MTGIEPRTISLRRSRLRAALAGSSAASPNALPTRLPSRSLWFVETRSRLTRGVLVSRNGGERWPRDLDVGGGHDIVERARPSVERVTPTLTVEEVDRLAAACDRVSRRYGDYVRLAALLGLRAGELTALQVGDVDLTMGVVTVRRAFSAGELQTPKSRRVRQVPVVGELGPILARMTSGRRSAELVLLGPLGGRLYHSNFRTKVRWPRAGQRVGLAGTAVS